MSVKSIESENANAGEIARSEENVFIERSVIENYSFLLLRSVRLKL